MTRLRSPAQRAPQTTGQAVVLLERYAERSARIGAVQARRQALLAKVNAAADALVVPLVAELKDAVKQLKPWWAASIEELTGGRRKSIELGGCLIGYRINPPKVTFADGDEDAAVAALLDGALGELVRTKQSPDKPAILKLLDVRRQALLAPTDGDAPADDPVDDDGARLEALGFAIDQKEVFFVDALTPAAAGAIVADPDAGAVG